jgi:hypothetical protein
MMSFQTIFEQQTAMMVNNRRVVGQQVSRGGQIRTAQYLNSVPWVFTVTPNNFLYYPTARSIIQTIDNLDRQLSETINFSSSRLSWFVSYQGAASTTPTTMTLASAPATNATTLSITNVPAATGNIFLAGDFIMVGGYTYKVTANVVRAATISVPIHRPVIGSPASGAAVACGVNCTFAVYAESCPTYTLNPMTNGAFVEWSGPFVFREAVAP